MRKLMKPMGALCLFVLLCVFPQEAREGVQEALKNWVNGVVPSLLPFLIALPALSCEEACVLYKRVFGRILPRFGVPGEMAGAVIVGLTSGSPAGAAALSRLGAHQKMDRNEALRCAWLGSGASMGFLLSTIPGAMLGRPELGKVLLRAQLAGQLCAGWMLRRAAPLSGKTAKIPGKTAQDGVIRGAAMSLLSIGICMAFFRVLAGLIVCALGSGVRTPVLAALELAGGCQALAMEALPMEIKLACISATACLGGLSACVQSGNFLKPLGIPMRAYVPGKLLGAALSGAFAWLQMRAGGVQEVASVPEPCMFGALCVSVLLFGLCVGRIPDILRRGRGEQRTTPTEARQA